MTASAFRTAARGRWPWSGIRARARSCHSWAIRAARIPTLLLLRQYRYAAGGYLYEIPAGRLDSGESPLDCARRELREETGCTAAGLEELCAAFMTPGFADEKIHIFLATGLTRGEASYEADEFFEVHVVKLSRALTMVRAGEIADAKSLIGIFFATCLTKRAEGERRRHTP